MRHITQATNIALLTPRMTADSYSPLVADTLVSNKTGSRYDQTYFFPLYLYPDPEKEVGEEGDNSMLGRMEVQRRVNFDPKIYAQIRAAAGLAQSSPERGGGAANSSLGVTEGAHLASGAAVAGEVGPLRPSGAPPRAGEEFANAIGQGLPDELRVFDYIYGVLHSPDYRRTYAQFLKIDFPRIPYPASPQIFAHLAEKGGQLRRLHLMEDAAIGETPYPFMGEGSDEVGKLEFRDNKVFINPDQWFEGVPDTAWTFHIGGYQPAQKWLKDRKGRKLSFDDVRHYQKIVKILGETHRIMQGIELPLD